MSSHIDDLPAILGGAPVRQAGPPTWPMADADVRAALDAAFASGAWGQYLGPNVCALEDELAAFNDVPHALTCASGTLAVEIALRALNIGPGSDVVMAAYDFESNFHIIHALGARPVLADVAANNWNLDAATLGCALTPNTKAIICSHIHGGLVPMREVCELAAARGIPIVEDAAQATGAMVQDDGAGTWGDIGTLSFGGSKLVTAGRGGALLFRDAKLHQRAKLLLARGIQQWAPMSELQAAVIRPQLAKLVKANFHRVANVERILQRLRDLDVPGLAAFTNPIEESYPSYYKLGFRFDATAFGLSREVFVNAMQAEGIAFNPGFRALHVNRSPSRFVANHDLIEATRAHEECVTLHHPVLSGTAADAEEVATAAAKVYRNRDQFGRLDTGPT